MEWSARSDESRSDLNPLDVLFEESRASSRAQMVGKILTTIFPPPS